MRMQAYQCDTCAEVHFGIQVRIEGVHVCPTCRSAKLTPVTKEAALKIILPWRAESQPAVSPSVG